MLTFETERLILRLLKPGDALAMELLIDDYEIAKTTLNIPHPYPKGSAESFIHFRTEVAKKGDGFSFAILEKTNRVFTGVIGLHIDKNHKKAELAYWIGKPYWSKGYVTEAANRICEFVFHDLELNRLWAAAMTKNPASSRVMKKIGMSYEGTFRQHFLKWDKYEDIEYYAMLKGDFLKKAEGKPSEKSL